MITGKRGSTMNRKFVLSLAGVALIFLGVVTDGNATTVAHRSESEMVKYASAIVRAKVLSVQPRRHGENLIVTDVVMEVLGVLKAGRDFKRDTRLFRMVQLGGTLGDRTLFVPGTSPYESGEEVVIFMEMGGGDLVEMGVGSGKFIVERSGDVATITRAWSGVAMAVVSGPRAGPLVKVPEPKRERLVDFEKRILTHLNSSIH